MEILLDLRTKVSLAHISATPGWQAVVFGFMSWAVDKGRRLADKLSQKHPARQIADLDLSFTSVSPWLKYLIFQIPGWIGAAIILIGLAHWQWLPRWLAAVCFVGWVIKDLLLYRFLRRAYEPDATGAARLIGERGAAEGDLTPEGYVRVRGELWRAVANPGTEVISSGTEVEIVSVERMQIVVRVAPRRSGP
jgi:membrane protein implicated in regulation of membrane protease activity